MKAPLFVQSPWIWIAPAAVAVPVAVAVAVASGSIYVADRYNNRAQIYQYLRPAPATPPVAASRGAEGGR